MARNVLDAAAGTDSIPDGNLLQTQGDLSRSIFDDMRSASQDTQGQQSEAATFDFIDFSVNDPFTTNELQSSDADIHPARAEGAVPAAQSADSANDLPETHTESWGNREVDVHADGSASYTVKKGDTLWSISRDMLKSQHAYDPAYRPSNSEIRHTVKEIARLNHIENADRIDIDQELELKSRTEPVISSDKSGRVTRVDYPNGRPAHSFSYDADGNLTGVRDDQGLQWRKEEGKWNQTNDCGESINSADTITVSSSGDLAIGFSDGEITIDRLGRGSMLTKDQAGRATEIYYPDGRPSNMIGYDEAGNPTLIRNDQGFEWTKGDSGWEHRSPDGRKIGSADVIEVNSRGDIAWKSNDGSEVVLSRDGSTAMK